MSTTGTRDASAAPVTDLAEQLIEVIAPLLAQQRRKWAQRCQAHGLSIVGVHALALLEEAGLIRTERMGRSKFHFLDLSPLETAVERWIPKRKGRDA